MMREVTTVLIICGLCFSTFVLKGQTEDSAFEPMTKFYEKNSPLDFLRILRADFEMKDQLNIYSMTSSPDNWVKEEHIEELMKMIYSPDSTKSIVNILSSYLATGKFSSIGREAQNLVDSFRTKEHYPPLWSFGSPDQEKAKELEEWWTNYKNGKR